MCWTNQINSLTSTFTSTSMYRVVRVKSSIPHRAVLQHVRREGAYPASLLTASNLFCIFILNSSGRIINFSILFLILTFICSSYLYLSPPFTLPSWSYLQLNFIYFCLFLSTRYSYSTLNPLYRLSGLNHN